MPERSLVQTHTIAALEVSPATFAEVTRLLRAAGHDHVFSQADEGILIDMTGFGLVERTVSCSP